MMLLRVILLCCLGMGAGAAQSSRERPNIIFILADDLGIPAVGCYGGNYPTPNLDRLAAGGVRFEHCFAAPMCGPSRAMALTGRYGFRTGVVDNNSAGRAVPVKEITIGKVLQNAGYATAVAGKWRQLGHFRSRAEGKAWGFDEFLIWGVGGKVERYWDPVFNRNGDTLEFKGKYGPDLLHEFLVDFIERHRDRPFFVYYPTPLIHGPILRTPDSVAGTRERRALYVDNIVYLDQLVGKLVGVLDRLKLRERTLIVFTGDNGLTVEGTLHQRTVDGIKGSMREGGSRVPLILNCPGRLPAGAVFSDLVDLTDFFPTFTDLAGGQLPSGVKLDGRSFAPRLEGRPGQPREWVYIQLGEARYVRSARWKLTGTGEFYDLKQAPFEERLVPHTTSDVEATSARARLGSVLQELLSSREIN